MIDKDATKGGDVLGDIEARLAGDYTPPPKARFDLNIDELFGGIAGLKLPVERYELLPGLVLSTTFAHVILPAVMAFAPPHKPHAPHPGPWAALTEQGMEILAQLSLAPGVPS